MAQDPKNPPADPKDPKAPNGQPPAARPAKAPDVKPPEKGEAVRVVLADGTSAPATVTGARGTLADLAFEHLGEPVVITGSPHDATAKKPDSWHRA